MNRQRRSSALAHAVKVALLGVGTIASIFLAFQLFEASAPSSHPSRGSDVTPQIMFMTNERRVGLQYQVNYYNHFYATPESLEFGSASGPLPTGAREIQMQFIDGRQRSTLRYAILFSQSARELNPVGQQQQQVSSGDPGSIVDADCAAPRSMGVARVMYGTVRLDASGDGTVDTVGTLSDQHAFLTDGTAEIVGLVDIVPAAGDLEPPGRLGQPCAVRLPDWPYLGGVQWYSPTNLTGVVSVGQVGDNYRVASSDPPLTDASSLSWLVRGPASIDYTLTNSNLERQQAIELFAAGVLAALATGLAIEVVKGTADIFDGPDHKSQLASNAKPPNARGNDDSPANPRFDYFLVRLLKLAITLGIARQVARQIAHRIARR